MDSTKHLHETKIMRKVLNLVLILEDNFPSAPHPSLIPSDQCFIFICLPPVSTHSPTLTKEGQMRPLFVSQGTRMAANHCAGCKHWLAQLVFTPQCFKVIAASREQISALI